MKYLPTLLISLLAVFESHGQENPKYILGISGGFLTTIAERGPRSTTEVGDVEFLNPMSAIGNIYFDIKMHKKLWVGIEFGLDQFNFGYLGTPKYPFDGISSGSLTAYNYIYLYKAGLRFSYHIPLSRRFSLHAIVNPAIGYYAYNHDMDDTARTNSYMYNVRPPGSNKIKYIRYPRMQKEGLHFTAKATLMLAWQVGKRLAITGDVAYQQGFSNFLIDSMSIRQYEPVSHKKYEHLYYTKVNGSSFQFHFGLQYRFGKRD